MTDMSAAYTGGVPTKAKRRTKAKPESEAEVKVATPPRRQPTGQEIPSPGLLLPPNLEFMELERTYTVA